jgi:hypothetical protein
LPPFKIMPGAFFIISGRCYRVFRITEKSGLH